MSSGYVEVWLSESDPFFCMANNGYVYEHRLVMARLIGRPLTSNEEVHHRNRVKSDNRPENLELTTKAEHARHHKNRLEELEMEVQRLQDLLNG